MKKTHDLCKVSSKGYIKNYQSSATLQDTRSIYKINCVSTLAMNKYKNEVRETLIYNSTKKNKIFRNEFNKRNVKHILKTIKTVERN